MEYRTFGWDGPEWVLYFHFQTWAMISLGFHICLSAPNIEIHLPFGFIRAGRRGDAVKAREFRLIF